MDFMFGPPAQKKTKAEEPELEEPLHTNQIDPLTRLAVQNFKEFMGSTIDFGFELPNDDTESVEEAKAGSSTTPQKNIWCTTEKHYAVTEQNQVDFVDGIELNEIDRLLLNDKSSENDHGFFPFFFAEDHMLREAKQCSGPTLKDCLVWLAYGAQCPVQTLLPNGRSFPDVQEYIDERLIQPTLTEITEREDRETIARINIYRIFEILTVAYLEKLSLNDKALLLFAICRIINDDIARQEFLIISPACKLINRLIPSYFTSVFYR